MSEVAIAAAPSRSLWSEARARLMRNKAAVTSLIVLGCMTLAAFLVPLLGGHPYDKVYPEYVKVGPSLATYPKPEHVEAATRRIAARMRAEVQQVYQSDGPASWGRWDIVLKSERSIDTRLLAYFERSDVFGAPRIVERSADGTSMWLSVPEHQQHFLFGTDQNGRDLLARILLGVKISLAIGLLATAVALIIGVTYGATAGFIGGRVDDVMMRAVDILYALPFIFFVIMLVVFFGRNFVLMFLAVGAIEWLDMARIVRGQTLSIKRQEYIAAAEALGVSTRDIIKRHVIPNTLGTVVVYMTLLIPKVILLESFLSFLGLGVQEPMTSLGVLISEGARGIQGATYALVFPALFLVAMLSALNFLGDGLRDALDPKDR